MLLAIVNVVTFPLNLNQIHFIWEVMILNILTDVIKPTTWLTFIFLLTLIKV